MTQRDLSLADMRNRKLAERRLEEMGIRPQDIDYDFYLGVLSLLRSMDRTPNDVLSIIGATLRKHISDDAPKHVIVARVRQFADVLEALTLDWGFSKSGELVVSRALEAKRTVSKKNSKSAKELRPNRSGLPSGTVLLKERDVLISGGLKKRAAMADIYRRYGHVEGLVDLKSAIRKKIDRAEKKVSNET